MSASEAAGSSSSSSSPVRQDAEAEPEQPQHRWVALVSTAVILPDNDDDERVRAMASRANVYLDLFAPPLPSYLVLHPDRIVALDTASGDFARKPTAYILAASDDDFAHLFFRVTKPKPNLDSGIGEPAAEDEIMYLCNTHTRRATPLPAVPYSELKVEPQPQRSVGLIVDTAYGPGSYLVVQLSPRPPEPDSVIGDDQLLCYSTAERRWCLKPLITPAAVRMRNLCGENGVVAHGGRLYWLALAYGIFVCDPRAETSRLRFIPLPHDCQTWEEEDLTGINRDYVKQRRRLVPSDGHLRYVEIRGLPYDVFPDDAPTPAELNPSVRMHTLVDTEVEGEEPQWRLEYEVHFAEVWEHPSYDDAGLKREDVPHVALVDPDDHNVVYFLQDSNPDPNNNLLPNLKLFGLDVRTKEVVSCQHCPVRDDREFMLQNSRPIIDAWKQSPPPPPSPRAESLREAAQPSWYALISYPVLILCKRKSGARQRRIRLDLQVPPIISFMEMQLRRTAHVHPVGEQQPSAYILATDCSGRLLVQEADPVTNAPELYICDARDSTASMLPRIPHSALAVPAQPSRSFILMPNPLLRGHFVVAQLHPRDSTVPFADKDRLLLFNSASRQWSVRTLNVDASIQDHMLIPCAEATVIAHDNRIWWLALDYGVFICDLFTPRPTLRLIPLPEVCEMREELAHRVLVNQRRRVAPSEGQLRYIEVRGVPYEVEAHGDADAAPPPANPTVCLWTLVDPEPAAQKPWRLEYQVPLAEMWDDNTLPHRIPEIAFVDPNNHFVVYFFQGEKIFGLDVRAMEVVSCGDGLAEDAREREILVRNSRPLIDSWSWKLSFPNSSLSPPSHHSSPPYSHGGSAIEGKDKLSELDWDELQNAHLEVERVGFRGNVACVDEQNPLLPILDAPAPAAALPVPVPIPARDDASKALQEGILLENDKKKRRKMIANLRHLKKTLLSLES